MVKGAWASKAQAMRSNTKERFSPQACALSQKINHPVPFLENKSG